MTALKEFARIECPGLWQPAQGEQRVDVIVSFGDASLVIADKAGRALSHWSLAAVARVNPGEVPALFTPSADASETLEIDDETMSNAIDKVQQALMKARPRPGRLRGLMIGTGMAAVLAGLVLWLPEALVRHTVKVLPEPSRAEIGADLFRAIGRVSGSPCRSPRGDTALGQVHARLLAPAKGGLLVVREGIDSTLALPGGLILLHRSVVENHETPEAMAGYILAEAARREMDDPVARLLHASGPATTLRLLTTGHLPPQAVERYAETLVSQPAAEVQDAILLARFAEAGVPATPYAYALDITGESTVDLIEGDPLRSGGARAVLDDGDWVALQAICGG